MKKIISLTGAKHSGKLNLAMDLAKNSDVVFIRPYTDREVPLSDIAWDFCEFHYVSKETLDLMIKSEKVLSTTTINGDRFVFFEFQLTEAYNVMILDDYAVCEVKDNYKDVFTVKVHSDKEEKSDRVGEYLFDHEFNQVFYYGIDDIDVLEWVIYNEQT